MQSGFTSEQFARPKTSFLIITCIILMILHMNLAAIPEKPVEADPHRLCQRQKQIDYGKNTLGYERYTEAIPRYDHLLHI